MGSICAAEFCERVKKMVVSGNSRIWNKTAHRKRIYQLVVERLIFVCGRSGNEVFVHFSTRWALCEGQLFYIHAQSICHRRANERFCIHSAAQVVVQVG